MITSTLISVKQYIPILLRKFESIIKGKIIKEAGTGKEIVLSDSKIIAKERKVIKDSFYNFIDVQFSNLENDIHSIKLQNKDIVITPDDFETLVSEFKVEISTIYEAFVTEKKMGPSLTKLATITLSGLLINKANEQNKK